MRSLSDFTMWTGSLFFVLLSFNSVVIYCQ